MVITNIMSQYIEYLLLQKLKEFLYGREKIKMLMYFEAIFPFNHYENTNLMYYFIEKDCIIYLNEIGSAVIELLTIAKGKR